jgi:hypothetical protein
MGKKARTRTAAETGAQNVLAIGARINSPAPRSAWFVFGSEDSFMSDDDLRENLGKGGWTSSKHAKKGDTLFFYFIAPYRAVHFVARARCDAFFDEEFKRWRIYFESMVSIKPIHLSQLRELFDEKRLLLYVKDGKWIRPDFANRLLDHMVVVYPVAQEHIHRVRQHMLGKVELGEPASITLDELRQLQSSHFICEEEVEYHVLEPLLRLAQLEYPVRVQRRFDLPRRKTADYAAIESIDGRSTQRVRCIIEAKLNLGNLGNWPTNRHVGEARQNAEMCDAPGFVVMDRDRLVCFRTSEELPCLVLERATLDENGLSTLRAHILNEKTARPIVRQDHPTSRKNRRRRGRGE